jgi:hypothetical protein
MGDGLLIVHEQFATPYTGRDKRLNKLIDNSTEVAELGMKELYEAALEFKFSPDKKAGITFNETQLRELATIWSNVFLHIERLRTNRDFTTIDDYVNWRGLREPEQHTPNKLLRNVVRSVQQKQWTWHYPREELYRQLPPLLGLTEKKPIDWSIESKSFLKVWNRFN